MRHDDFWEILLKLGLTICGKVPLSIFRHWQGKFDTSKNFSQKYLYFPEISLAEHIFIEGV